MSLIFTVGQEFLPNHLNALANCACVNMHPSITATTNSSSFADTASTSSVSFTKVDADSRLRVDFHASCSVTGSVPSSAEFAVRINGVDYAIVKNTISVAALRKTFSGIQLIGSIAAGTYTVQGRWRRASGSGTLAMDPNDTLSFTISEVQE